MRKLILIASLFISAFAKGQTYTAPVNPIQVPTNTWYRNAQGMWTYRGSTLGWWLYADSLMVKRMIAASASGVTSFNSRTGAVTPLVGDYSSFFFPIPTGTTSQYIRGNGTLATFPSITSYSFDNGLTNSGGEVGLDGTLIRNTLVDVATNKIEFVGSNTNDGSNPQRVHVLIDNTDGGASVILTTDKNNPSGVGAAQLSLQSGGGVPAHADLRVVDETDNSKVKSISVDNASGYFQVTDDIGHHAIDMADNYDTDDLSLLTKSQIQGLIDTAGTNYIKNQNVIPQTANFSILGAGFASQFQTGTLADYLHYGTFNNSGSQARFLNKQAFFGYNGFNVTNLNGSTTFIRLESDSTGNRFTGYKAVFDTLRSTKAPVNSQDVGRLTDLNITTALVNPSTTGNLRNDQGAIVELQDGSGRFMVVYGHFGTVATDASAAVLYKAFSTDRGRTWGTPSLLLDTLTGGHSVQVPSFHVKTSNQHVIMLFFARFNTTAPVTSAIYSIEYSADMTSIISGPTQLIAPTTYFVPNSDRIFEDNVNGRLIYPYGKMIAGTTGGSSTSTYEGRLLTSSDDGATWPDNGLAVAGVTNSGGFGGVLEPGAYYLSSQGLVYYYRTLLGSVYANLLTYAAGTYSAGSAFTTNLPSPNSAIDIRYVSKKNALIAAKTRLIGTDPLLQSSKTDIDLAMSDNGLAWADKIHVVHVPSGQLVNIPVLHLDTLTDNINVTYSATSVVNTHYALFNSVYPASYLNASQLTISGYGIGQAQFEIPKTINARLPYLTTTTLADSAAVARVSPRVTALAANAATYSINTDTYNIVHITAQTATITNFTTTGTPADGNTLRISITATATTGFTFDTAKFEGSGGVTLSNTTTGTARLDMIFIWNTETSKWREVGVS